MILSIVAAVIFAEQGEFVRFWDQVFKIEPGKSTDLLALSDLCLEKGMFEWSIVCCRRVMGMEGAGSTYESAVLKLAKAEIGSGNVFAAYKRLRVLKKHGNKDATSLLEKGENLRTDEQRRLLQEAASEESRKNFIHARELYLKALSLVPSRTTMNAFVSRDEILKRLARCGGIIDIAKPDWKKEKLSVCKVCAKNKVPGYVKCEECNGKGKIRIKKTIKRGITRTYVIKCKRCNGYGFHTCPSCKGFSRYGNKLSEEAQKIMMSFQQKFLKSPQGNNLSFLRAVTEVERFLLSQKRPQEDLKFFYSVSLSEPEWMRKLDSHISGFPLSSDSHPEAGQCWTRITAWNARAYFMLYYASKFTRVLPWFSILAENDLGGAPDFKSLPLVNLLEIVPFPRKYKNGRFISFEDIFLGDDPGEADAAMLKDLTKKYLRFRGMDALKVHAFVWTQQAKDKLKDLARAWYDHVGALNSKYDFEIDKKILDLPFFSFVKVSGRLLYCSDPAVRRLFEIWRIDLSLTSSQSRLLPFLSIHVPAMSLPSCKVAEIGKFLNIIFGIRLKCLAEIGEQKVSINNSGCSLGLLLGKMAAALNCSCYWDGMCFRMSYKWTKDEIKDFKATVEYVRKKMRGRVTVERLAP